MEAHLVVVRQHGHHPHLVIFILFRHLPFSRYICNSELLLEDLAVFLRFRACPLLMELKNQMTYDDRGDAYNICQWQCLLIRGDDSALNEEFVFAFYVFRRFFLKSLKHH